MVLFDECTGAVWGYSQADHRGFGNVQICYRYADFRRQCGQEHVGKRTTKDLFEECLHKYVITDVIRDENVLKFSVELLHRARSD